MPSYFTHLSNNMSSLFTKAAPLLLIGAHLPITAAAKMSRTLLEMSSLNKNFSSSAVGNSTDGDKQFLTLEVQVIICISTIILAGICIYLSFEGQQHNARGAFQRFRMR